jgi:hypothetical protein
MFRHSVLVPRAFATWTVLPHGPLDQLSPSLMTVTGDLQMPLARLERRMTVIRLKDERLVIYSAIALDEPEMRKLEAFGTPTFLVVPSHLHCNDAFIWKQRYPELLVVAPSGARARIEPTVHVDTSSPNFDDKRLCFLEVPGTCGRESALEFRELNRSTLVLNDLVGNLPPGDGMVLRALGFATERPRIPRAVRRLLVQDRNALRRTFEGWSETELERILVSHGRPIVADASDILREIAQTL